jgi:hypothetical protein
VPVHPDSARVEQDRPANPVADGAFDGPADRRRQRYQDDTAALPKDPQDPVTVFLAEVADVGSSRLEDSEPEKAEHGD